MSDYTYDRSGLQWTVYRVHDGVRRPIASMLGQGAAMSVVRELESVRERAEAAETQVARMQHYLDIHLGRLRSLAAQYDPGKHGDCYDPVDALSGVLERLRAVRDAAESFKAQTRKHGFSVSCVTHGERLFAALDACDAPPAEQTQAETLGGGPNLTPGVQSPGLSPALRSALAILLADGAALCASQERFISADTLRAALKELRS